MLDKEILNQNYNDLEKLEVFLKDLNFETKLYNVEEDFPIPVLVVALNKDENGSICKLHVAFTPISSEDLQYTRMLQLSLELETDITDKNSMKLLKFSNHVNTFLPIGYYTLMDDVLCYRCVYPIANELDITNSSILETISLYSILFIQYEEIFLKLASGKFSYEDAILALSSLK